MMVARVLLCGCFDVLDGSWICVRMFCVVARYSEWLTVAIRLQWCSRWLPGCCYVVC